MSAFKREVGDLNYLSLFRTSEDTLVTTQDVVDMKYDFSAKKGDVGKCVEADYIYVYQFFDSYTAIYLWIRNVCLV